MDERRTPFTNAAVENHLRGVRYRYLIPDSQEIIARARRLQAYLNQYASSVNQLEFCIAACTPIFNQFGVTLYNSTVALSRGRGDQRPNINPDPIAVYFPHAEDADLSTDQSCNYFMAIMGPKALGVQEKLESLFHSSSKLDASETKR